MGLRCLPVSGSISYSLASNDIEAPFSKISLNTSDYFKGRRDVPFQAPEVCLLGGFWGLYAPVHGQKAVQWSGLP